MITVIVVTHNSDKYLDKLFGSLGLNYNIIVVDSGSSSTEKLERLCADRNSLLIKESNVGFAKANNIGYSLCPADTEYVAFVNPDLFINGNWLSIAQKTMEKPECSDVAILSSILERYDINSNELTGVVDSIGISKRLFWYDIAQGERIDTLDNKFGRALLAREAICGALMFCRKSALDSVLINEREVFWEKLFMYKEDIELSLRLRKAGFRLMVDMGHVNYHCRGWQERKAVPGWAKLISARNDVYLSMKYNKLTLPLFVAKYMYVRFVES